MHLFSRVATLTGGPIQPIEWAANITAHVNGLMGVELSLWQGQFGYPLGTVAWSAVFESRAHLAEETSKLAGDQGFLDLVGQGQEFATTPFTDTLRTVVHSTSEPGDAPPIGAWAELTTAAPAAGQIGAARAWGVEIADRYSAVTGTPSVFLADDYGPFGQLTWLVAHADAAAADRANEAVAGDADYVAAIDGGGGRFQPGSANRSALIRLA
ncbi:MAG: hypothetical protein ABWZ55_12130 [Acidimicrobiales bacterium]